MNGLKIRINGELIYSDGKYTINDKTTEYIVLCKKLFELAFCTKATFGDEIKKIHLSLDGS
jgi:hypothetical protein